MRKIVLFAILMSTAGSLFAQTLDRISISSGGNADNNVNYVIGENFNFAISGNGNITLETGTMGSTSNTGGLPTIVSIQKMNEIKNIPCYPNPARNEIYFVLNNQLADQMTVCVFDVTGKLMMSIPIQKADLMKIDLQGLGQGSYIATVSNIKADVLGSFPFVKQ
jgi:hypothetical protein